MNLRGLLAVLVLVPGCATVPGPGEIEPLLEPARFAPRTVASSPEDVFGLDDSMRAFLAGEVTERMRHVGPAHGLYEALNNGLQIGYDTEMTRTAREAFAARSGNCLSMVILTGTLARAVDLPVQYQRVYGEDTWSRAGDIAFRNGHVNLVINGGVLDRNRGKEVVIDFMSSPAGRRGSIRTITEDTVLAMYLNNRAAETMASGDLDAAYAWAEASVKRDPTYTTVYNTLGVIYLRHGDLAAAERVLRYTLGREPDNAEVLSNLVTVVAAAGRDAEAAVLREKLARIEQYPPYYFMDRGVAALSRGDDREALKWFHKELRRMPYDDEIHFAIALTELRLGDVRDARMHMTLALENSATQDHHDIYAAKLAHIRLLESR